VTLEKGEDILITGFGKFYINEKRERRGRNPKTGENLMLSPRRVVKFRPSGVLRDKMDGRSNIPLSEKLSENQKGNSGLL